MVRDGSTQAQPWWTWTYGNIFHFSTGVSATYLYLRPAVGFEPKAGAEREICRPAPRDVSVRVGHDMTLTRESNMTRHRTIQATRPAAPAAVLGGWLSPAPTASAGQESVPSRSPGRCDLLGPDSCLRTQSLQGQPRRFGTRMSRRPGSAGTMRGHALGTVVARHAHWRKPDLTVQLQCGIARPTSAVAESRSTDRTNNDDHMKAEQS
jgi:hypothetical protein